VAVQVHELNLHLAAGHTTSSSNETQQSQHQKLRHVAHSYATKQQLAHSRVEEEGVDAESTGLSGVRRWKMFYFTKRSTRLAFSGFE
jgi:uncharacterized protein YukE